MYQETPKTVIELGQMEIDGNIIPPYWFEHIRYKDGKPHLSAIVILSDIVYWYRPGEVRDEKTGKVIGKRKKFSDDKLQRSYSHYEDLYGLTNKQVRDAFDCLRKSNIIETELRTITAKDGRRIPHVMYVDLNVPRLKEITYTPNTRNGENETLANNVGRALQGGPRALQGGPRALQVQTNTETTTETTTERGDRGINVDPAAQPAHADNRADPPLLEIAKESEKPEEKLSIKQDEPAPEPLPEPEPQIYVHTAPTIQIRDNDPIPAQIPAKPKQPALFTGNSQPKPKARYQGFRGRDDRPPSPEEMLNAAQDRYDNRLMDGGNKTVDRGKEWLDLNERVKHALRLPLVERLIDIYGLRAKIDLCGDDKRLRSMHEQAADLYQMGFTDESAIDLVLERFKKDWKGKDPAGDQLCATASKMHQERQTAAAAIADQQAKPKGQQLDFNVGLL